jgi:acetyltransferase-like isoleucine patch superfamily enzyme
MVLRNALARAAAPLRGAAQAQLSSAGVIGTLAPLARAGAPRHYRNPVENELYDRSRQEYSLGNRVPSVAADAWIAPNATLIGDTDVADQCSVWHGAVLKGDLGPVRLGAFSNVQERCVIDAAGCVE